MKRSKLGKIKITKENYELNHEYNISANDFNEFDRR